MKLIEAPATMTAIAQPRLVHSRTDPYAEALRSPRTVRVSASEIVGLVPKTLPKATAKRHNRSADGQWGYSNVIRAQLRPRVSVRALTSPSRASAICPHAGARTAEISEVAAKVNPIAAGETPRCDRYTTKKGM